MKQPSHRTQAALASGLRSRLRLRSLAKLLDLSHGQMMPEVADSLVLTHVLQKPHCGA